MAYSASSFWISLGSVSAIFLCICHADLVDDICRGSDKPPFCLETLRSGSNSVGAEKWSLGVFAVDKAVGAGRVAITKARSNSNPGNKNRMDALVFDFNTVINNLNNICRPILVSKSSGKVREVVVKAANAGYIIRGYKNDLGSISENVIDLVDVVSAVARSLRWT